MDTNPQFSSEPNIEETRRFGDGVDFGKTASDYRAFRAGFPDGFFEAISDRGLILPDASALDLGTGSGTVARGLALRGMRVTGVDPAEAMLAEARALDAVAGVRVDYQTGKAEQIGFPNDSFDLITAGQCWHWFDRPKAAAEAYRCTKPGGHMVIAHFDWIPLPGNVVAATEAQILRYNPSWPLSGSTGIYPPWLGDLTVAGFRDLTTFSFDLAVPYSHEGWRGRIRASAGVRASLDAAMTAQFDRELAALLARQFPADPLAVPHRVWAVIGVKPSGD